MFISEASQESVSAFSAFTAQLDYRELRDKPCNLLQTRQTLNRLALFIPVTNRLVSTSQIYMFTFKS